MNFPRSIVRNLVASCRNCVKSRRTRYSLLSLGITRVWHFFLSCLGSCLVVRCLRLGVFL